jgi:hypothetical protein
MITRTPPTGELLRAWERGRRAPVHERALLLLAAAVPDAAHDALARLPLGERDAGLLELRERVFGPELNAVADCPSCGMRVEFAVRADEMRGDAATGDAARSATPPIDSAVGAPEELRVGAYAVTFRLPTTADVASIALGPTESYAGAARAALLERCVLAATADGVSCTAASLPDEVVTAVERRMDDLEPYADVRLTLHCPGCSEEWLAALAVADFVWADVDSWAWQTLGQVHALARAYGWREADVLAMSPARRELYLEMVRG